MDNQGVIMTNAQVALEAASRVHAATPAAQSYNSNIESDASVLRTAEAFLKWLKFNT
jgi:hypothetical protein